MQIRDMVFVANTVLISSTVAPRKVKRLMKVAHEVSQVPECKVAFLSSVTLYTPGRIYDTDQDISLSVIPPMFPETAMVWRPVGLTANIV
jgi:hypothetical protein